MSAKVMSNGSSQSAISRRSLRLPAAISQALWIIRKAARPMRISSPAMAMKEAAEAARPMMFTVTLPLCSRSRL
ncbi:hypothetical protein D9M71_771710 [compost metagenome]